MKITEANLANLEGGAAVEAVDEALKKVWVDLYDLDKIQDATRTVTMTITVTPKKEKPTVPEVRISVNTKLAKLRPVVGEVYLERQSGGKIRATQYDPEQGSLFKDDRKPGDVAEFPKDGTKGGTE